MSDERFAELYRIVLARLNSGKLGGKPKHVRKAIYDHHMHGRLDGFLITWENQHWFRMYRNNVSPDPKHLIDAALAFHGEGKA